MSEMTDEDRRILAYLHERAAGGERYFRAKHIAEGLGLSAKQVGARLAKLADSADEVEIEKWGRARSTTWRVTPQ